MTDRFHLHRGGRSENPALQRHQFHRGQEMVRTTKVSQQLLRIGSAPVAVVGCSDVDRASQLIGEYGGSIVRYALAYPFFSSVIARSITQSRCRFSPVRPDNFTNGPPPIQAGAAG